MPFRSKPNKPAADRGQCSTHSAHAADGLTRRLVAEYGLTRRRVAECRRKAATPNPGLQPNEP